MLYKMDRGMLLQGGQVKYCPLHGGGGDACGNWCAMFEIEELGGGFTQATCYAYKKCFPLEPAPAIQTGTEKEPDR